VLRVSGEGHIGCGENVAFSVSEQQQFAVYAQNWFAAQAREPKLTVGSALGAFGTPYERAALEAALIDLGLRQAGLSLYELTGQRAVALRFVVSFAATPDPVARIGQLHAAGYTGDFKIDAHPDWNARTLEGLARQPALAIVDLKARATLDFAERLAKDLPLPLLEDPPADFEPAARVARDASLTDARAVAVAIARGEAVNLKAPRMGGPLELLRALEHALTSNGTEPARAYLGGMFEVGVGRFQARQLAALYCPEGPNDLAANLVHDRGAFPLPMSSPIVIELDRPGFGEHRGGTLARRGA
jgi:L-alanine-DL-glutamate epimerase-like enolase superfamily enzyme